MAPRYYIQGGDSLQRPERSILQILRKLSVFHEQDQSGLKAIDRVLKSFSRKSAPPLSNNDYTEVVVGPYKICIRVNGDLDRYYFLATPMPLGVRKVFRADRLRTILVTTSQLSLVALDRYGPFTPLKNDVWQVFVRRFQTQEFKWHISGSGYMPSGMGVKTWRFIYEAPERLVSDELIPASQYYDGPPDLWFWAATNNYEGYTAKEHKK